MRWPLLFASGAAASAGAATALLSMTDGEGPSIEAHRLAIVGVAGELAASEVRARGWGASTRRTDPPSRRFHQAARLLSATGAALSVGGRRRRSLAVARVGV